VLKLEKYDQKAKTAYGWATVTRRDDGTPLIDSDGHLIPVEVLKRAVQDAFAESSGAGKTGVNHFDEMRGSADLVESMVFSNELKSAINNESPGFFGDSKREGWMVGVRVSDPGLQKRLESGELAEFSLRGYATDWEQT